MDELWQDVLKFKREEEAPTCQASALITPIPEDVTRYIGGDKTVKYQQLAKLDCQVKCEKCGITVKSKWLSKTSAASLERLDSPFAVIACPTCQTAYLDNLRSQVYAKWSSRMLKIWLDCLRMPPAQLGYYESRQIAKEIFNSNPDFLSLVWDPKKGLGVIKSLIQHHFVVLDLSKKCELYFTFRKIEIEKTPMVRHS